jgi:gluconate 2-dehydrogenase gamma chain
MTDGMGRRSALRLIGAAPAALGLTLSPREAAAAAEQASKAVRAAAKGKAYVPKFFNPQEWKTVRVLVDMIIPADERSGSATDAGVPEFMDYVMNDPADTDILRERRQTAMRGGLAWINRQAVRRFDTDFADCTEAQRVEVLDEIAYYQGDDEEEKKRKDVEFQKGDPAATQGGPEVHETEEAATTTSIDRRVRIEHGPSFFNSFRDLTASGFWSSKMGIEDLKYVGNTFVAEWKGPPPEVLARLGLTEE